jgi:hypothetical protein
LVGWSPIGGLVDAEVLLNLSIALPMPPVAEAL